MQLMQFLTNRGTQLVISGVDNSGRKWYTWSGHLGTQLIQFLDRGTQLVLPRFDMSVSDYPAPLCLSWKNRSAKTRVPYGSDKILYRIWGRGAAIAFRSPIFR